ncbi:MAG: hypothetical protein IKT52_13170 [Oscillospiraceae bacterium]|nr:hypothetical protein [Oscillospiraceae bacterium]
MTEKTRRIIQMIAAKEGTTPKEVEKKMRESIKDAMASSNPQAQAMWKQICPDGKEPDLDTFLNFMVHQISVEKNNKYYRNPQGGKD